MKTTDSRTREVLMTDKGKGNLCLLCEKPTGSKNISVCEECIFDNNIFESLVIFKNCTHRTKSEAQEVKSEINSLNYIRQKIHAIIS